MNLFTISDLSRFSGIKPHTIRIWEQRYEALSPSRSEGNTRYYDGEQLRRLLNIVSLMNTGKKISQVGNLDDEDLFNMVMERIPVSADTENSTDYFVAQLIAAGLNYNESYFDKMFSAGVIRYGLKNMYIKVIHPMLMRVGIMWASNTLPPANEHFISNLVRQKLYSAIDTLPPPVVKKEKWLLFLPEGEYHELGLLLANYLIRKSGRDTIYLGANLPLTNLSQLFQTTGATHLLTFIVHKDFPENTRDLLKVLRKNFKGEKMLIAIDEMNSKDVKISMPFYQLHSVEDLEFHLDPGRNKGKK